MTEEHKINQILGRFFIDGTKGDYLDALHVAVEEIQQLKNCNLQNVSGSLPSKEEAVNTGYNIASSSDYNYRNVLKDGKDDISYSGWMDCYDWMAGNYR